MALPENIDTEKLAEIALALLSLTAFKEHGAVRAWKGLDWDVLDLLYERGWILNPVGKAKSIVLTEVGHRLAEQSFTKHFARAGT
jgi:hypothetical protein